MTVIGRLVLLSSATSAPPSALGPPRTPAINPCTDTQQNFSTQKWCDATLPLDDRVTDMISRMTVPEKIVRPLSPRLTPKLGAKMAAKMGAKKGGAFGEQVSLVSSRNGVRSLGLPAYNWRSEANNGVDYFSSTPLTPHSTKFAYPCTTTMAFNKTMYREFGAQVGREARALANVGNAAGTFWTPVVNLAREPRWGRNYETPGE